MYCSVSNAKEEERRSVPLFLYLTLLFLRDIIITSVWQTETRDEVQRFHSERRCENCAEEKYTLCDCIYHNSNIIVRAFQN